MEQNALPPPHDDDLINGGKTMPLLDHLAELRSVLIKAALIILVIFIAAMSFASHIIDFLKAPLLASLPEGAKTLHFTGPLDVFIASLKVSFLTAVVFGSPFWLFQFWKFFEPGLYPRERKLVLPFAIASILLFFAGIAFCFFLILPMTLDFLINLGLEVGTPIITVNDYISIVMILLFAFGLVFETPVILVLLAMLDLITAKGLKDARPFVLVATLVVGAVLTPPDPISQIALAVPVYIMYEISIIIISFIQKPPQETELAVDKKP